jgi:hypothetical protein
MPKEKQIGGNNTPYIKYIETLVLDLLIQAVCKGKDEVFLSKNQILSELRMINKNYGTCKERIPKLSQFLNIDRKTIEEWYESTDGTLKRNLETALDSLKKQSLILWSSEITVCEVKILNNLMDVNKNIKIDEYDEEITTYKVNAGFHLLHREATKQEKKFILHTEREIMKEMGYDNKQDIVKFGAWDNFKKKVNSILLEQFKISFYYNSYKILFNEDHIQEQYEEMLEKFLLQADQRQIEYTELNNAVIERLKGNTIKRQNRALEESEMWMECCNEITNEKIKMRVEDNYINNTNKLIDVLIHKESEDIKKKIKRIKLNKK